MLIPAYKEDKVIVETVKTVETLKAGNWDKEKGNIKDNHSRPTKKLINQAKLELELK